MWNKISAVALYPCSLVQKPKQYKKQTNVNSKESRYK